MHKIPFKFQRPNMCSIKIEMNFYFIYEETSNPTRLELEPSQIVYEKLVFLDVNEGDILIIFVNCRHLWADL